MCVCVCVCVCLCVRPYTPGCRHVSLPPLSFTAREQARATATSSICSSASNTTSYAPSTALSSTTPSSTTPSSTAPSSTIPSSSSFPPPHPQQRAPSNYQPGNVVTPEGNPDRSCSSLESMVVGAGGAGRPAGGVVQRPTSINRSWSNEERTYILKSEHQYTHTWPCVCLHVALGACPVIM